jgi:hypothetical protein
MLTPNAAQCFPEDILTNANKTTNQYEMRCKAEMQEMQDMQTPVNATKAANKLLTPPNAEMQYSMFL